MDDHLPFPPIPQAAVQTALSVTTMSTITVDIKFVITVTDDYTLSDALTDLKHFKELVKGVASDIEKFDSNMSNDLTRQTT